MASADPLDVTRLMRIERDAEAGPLGHVGDLADDRHGPIVEAIRRRLSARDGDPNLGVAAFELLDSRFQAGRIGRLGRVETRVHVDAEHFQPAGVELPQHLGYLGRARKGDAIVAQVLQELGLLVQRFVGAAGAVVEGVEGPGGGRPCRGGQRERGDRQESGHE